MGYFSEFKLHIAVNDMSKIINFVITHRNVDDRQALKNENFLKKVAGKLFADKRYVSQKLSDALLVDEIQLVPGIRNNTKNQLITMFDKIMLRK